MGTSVITIRVTGNHGCQRGVKDGGTTAPKCAECNDEQAQRCVDAVAREFAERLKATGNVDEAHLVHWPYGPNIIIDDLKTGKRSGSF